MKRTALLVALMLSLGVNIGLFLPRLVQPDHQADSSVHPEEASRTEVEKPASTTSTETDSSPSETTAGSAGAAPTQPTGDSPVDDEVPTATQGVSADRAEGDESGQDEEETTGDGSVVLDDSSEVDRNPRRRPIAERRQGSVRARREVEMLANRLRLAGPERRRFMRLQAEMVRSTREMMPRLERLRRDLYSNVVSESPSRETIEETLEEMVRTQIALEQRVIRTVMATRDLLDDEQEAIYLRFLSRRLGPLRDALQAGQPGRAREP